MYKLFCVLVNTDAPQMPGEEDFLDKLIPNFWSFLIQLLALIVMIVVVIFFAYKPVKKMLKKRQDYIEDNIRESDEAKAAAIVRERESRELIIASQKQANEIIENAKGAANAEKAEIIAKTEAEIEQMRINAKENIKREEADAVDAIRKEMVSIALDASEQILKRNVSSKDNEKLVEDFIEGIDK